MGKKKYSLGDEPVGRRLDGQVESGDRQLGRRRGFFIARLVVELDWDDPVDVTPVWLVEGLPEPKKVMLYLE